MPWLWILALAGIVSLFTAGIQFDILLAMAKELLPVPTFFAAWYFLSRSSRGVTICIRALVLAGAVVAVAVLFGHGLRGEGTFTNPNYAGHLLGCALVVTWLGSRPKFQRVALTLLFGAAMVRTGSFGAWLVVVGAVAYWLWSRPVRKGSMEMTAVRCLLVLLLASTALAFWSNISASNFDLGSGLNEQRFDRSRSARLDLWRSGYDEWISHPIGIGSGRRVNVGGSATGATSELHNDAVAFLVGNGPLGLLAVVALVIVIWRSLGRGGPGRALLAGLIASSLVRQTWNFRHAWLMLAVVAAYEMADWTRHKADAVPAVDAGARAKAL